MPILPRTTCRSCFAPLAPVLSLGSIYLSDFPRSAGTRTHPPVPLDLQRCTAPTCGLVQLAHTTPPDWLFRTYWYRSGVNETMVAELQDLVRQASHRVSLQPHQTVVDIGANDGTLLQQYPEALHLTTVAWEPAANLYEVLRPHARVVFPEYFHVEQPWEEQARLVTCAAMFYDLDDPHAFLEGVTKVLHPAGLLVIQQAYLPAMLRQTAFDNICHEHLAYYDLHSLEAVLAPHTLRVVDVEERPINGGSFRATVAFTGGPWRPGAAVGAFHQQEEAFYLDRPRVFEAFAHRVARVKDQLGALLEACADHQVPVDLYAASTKSNTLLQYCGVDARVVRQAWERSPEKWGRYVGVSGIPIVSEAEGRKAPPLVLLVGAWQWKDYFLEREKEYLQAGGKMVFPLPAVETVTQVQRSTSVKAGGGA